MSRSISVVMPIYNEEDLLMELFRRMTLVLDTLEHDCDCRCEWIMVNDGSRDRSLEMLRAQSERDHRVVVVDLTRNFGHQPAIQAGLKQAQGEGVVVMDADLQDPPELLPELVKSWRAGNQVVIAKRRSRAETGMKGLLFRSFHSLLGRVSDMPIETDSGVFGLLDRRVVRDLVALPERNRFLPGLRSWVGYKQSVVLYDRDSRAAGAPKQTFGRLLKYAFDAIFSFSYKPLRAIWTLGLIVSIWSVLYALFLIILRLLKIDVVPGFTTPTVAILFLGGAQLVSVGVLGEYLGRIYDEVKQRPLFLVNEVITQRTALKSGEWASEEPAHDFVLH